jgi:hypothetical protein
MTGSPTVERSSSQGGNPAAAPVPPATFGDRAGWTSGAESGAPDPGPDDVTFTWATTARFLDAPYALPPHRTLENLPDAGLLIEVLLFDPAGADPPPPYRLEGPLKLDPTAAGEDYPGGDGSRWFQRLGPGRIGNRSIDIWVFAGSAHPSAAQIEEAQAMLDTLILPTWQPNQTSALAKLPRGLPAAGRS